MTSGRIRPRRLAAVLARSRTVVRDRKGNVAMMFGIAAIPLMLLVGIAIDFGFISQTRAQLDLAADSAALTAAQTASTTFTSAYASNPTGADALAEAAGEAAGTSWFCTQVGAITTANFPSQDMTSHTNCPANNTSALNIAVTPNGNAFSATVSYAASVPSMFQALFGMGSTPLSDTVSATITVNGYVDVTFLLDNSSSMLIASTSAGITTVQPLTANSSCWQVTSANGNGNPPTPSCTGSTSCTQGSQKVTVYASNNAYGINSLQGCQCAFACHWQSASGSATFRAAGVDTESGAANTSNSTQTYSLDYYGIARAAGVQLRFDVVQSAVETAISFMQTSEVIPNQFGASIFEFGNTLTQDWPPTNDTAAQTLVDMACLNSTASGCNGNALAAAQSISSPVVTDAANTAFPAIMASLTTTSQAELAAQGLQVAGDGSSQAKARRALIIITDGIQDWGGRAMVAGYSLGAGASSNPNGAEGPISANDCVAMKSLGYTIYVLYTTYITTPATVVLNNTALVPYVDGTTGTDYDLPTNMQDCATVPANYAQASDPADITAALQSMVNSAINSGAQLTQ